MEKFAENIGQIEESAKVAHKRIDACETRLSKLENTYGTLETMNYRIGEVEKTLNKVDRTLEEGQQNKGKKWDKLIDYLFYFIIALILGYIANQLNL